MIFNIYMGDAGYKKRREVTPKKRVGVTDLYKKIKGYDLKDEG